MEEGEAAEIDRVVLLDHAKYFGINIGIDWEQQVLKKCIQYFG